MGHVVDLGTIDANDRRVGADDWSGRPQVGSRRVNRATLSSIFPLVDSETRERDENASRRQHRAAHRARDF